MINEILKESENIENSAPILENPQAQFPVKKQKILQKENIFSNILRPSFSVNSNIQSEKNQNQFNPKQTFQDEIITTDSDKEFIFSDLVNNNISLEKVPINVSSLDYNKICKNDEKSNKVSLVSYCNSGNSSKRKFNQLIPFGQSAPRKYIRSKGITCKPQTVDVMCEANIKPLLIDRGCSPIDIPSIISSDATSTESSKKNRIKSPQ